MEQHIAPTVSGERLTGRLKVEPEDFVVEEIPAYLPSGEGEHLYLWIQKRDLSADQLLGHLSRSLRLPREQIGMAGLKDRRAITRQWVSVPAACEAMLSAVENESVCLLKTSRHTNKLKTGHLRGNRFEILVRDVPQDSLPLAQRIADEITRSGIPNRFGDQRFGHDGNTAEMGFRLLTGDMTPRDLPPSRRKFLLRLALSAAQSTLFNGVLDRRREQGWLHAVQCGDIMQVDASGGLFLAEEVAVEQPRFERRETVPTGPLFGPKMKQPTGKPLELEQQILAESGLTPDQFREYSKLTSGARRPLLLWPDELSAEFHPDGILFRFGLPSGAYATVVLDQFLQNAGA